MKRKKRKYTRRKVSSPKSDSAIETIELPNTDKPIIPDDCPLCDGKGYRELDKAGLIRVRCKCKA